MQQSYLKLDNDNPGRTATASGMPLRFMWTNGEFQTDFVNSFERLTVRRGALRGRLLGGPDLTPWHGLPWLRVVEVELSWRHAWNYRVLMCCCCCCCSVSADSRLGSAEPAQETVRDVRWCV